MRVRLSQQGSLVAAPEQTVEQIRDHLAAQQQLWAEQLTRDPGAFALLEPQIHLAFGKLADQLVASLLAHAALQQALAAAANKKVTDAPTPLRKPQARPLTVRLLGGLVLYLSTLYCAPLARTGKGRGREGAGLYPELSVLGISEGSSPALLSTVGRQCALLPSYHLAQQELAARGTSLDIKVVHRIARQLGASTLTCRTRDLLDWRAGRVPAGSELAGKRVAAMLDGGRTRLRTVVRKQKGKGKQKKQRRHYKAEWREPKLLIIFEIDEQGRMRKKTRPWLDGTFAGPDEAMELLAYHLHRLGAKQAKVVVFVADGAPWIWERLDWVQRRVGLWASRCVRVLDWCHAVHNLSLALQALGLAEEERQRLHKEMRGWLHEGWHGLVLNELQRLGEAAGNPEGLEQPLGYLGKHAAAGHLEYKRLRRRGLPQGSGAIESAIRRVINLRLKGPGLMWHAENAEAALALRAAAVSERWEETMAHVREGMGRDRHLNWQWQAPDMLAQLKANLPIKPPVPQKPVTQ
jgi:hypothetical protein